MAIRNRFEEQLAILNNSLIEMGKLVERRIQLATKALIEQDTNITREIISSDIEVDDREKDIENQCMRLIMQQQPVARDLRAITAILKIITDLERIGDHAVDISEITEFMAGKEYIKKLEHIPQMAEATIKMLSESIDAFVRRDDALAYEVIAYDDVVDDLFMEVKRELIALIKKDVSNGDQALDLLMVAKYFERIGDHATNVAEWVIFSDTGIRLPS